jgi:hypothetical protein
LRRQAQVLTFCADSSNLSAPLSAFYLSSNARQGIPWRANFYPDKSMPHNTLDHYIPIINEVARDFEQAANEAIKSSPANDKNTLTCCLALAADKWSKNAAHKLDDLPGAEVTQLYKMLSDRLKMFESSGEITLEAFQRAENCIKANVRNATQTLSLEQYEALNRFVLCKLADKNPVILNGCELLKQVGQFTGILRSAYEKTAATNPPPFWFKVLVISPCFSYKYNEWVEIEFTRKD